MSKHTPGPWQHGFVNESTGNSLHPNIVYASEDGRGICSVYGIPLHTPFKDVDERSAEAMATARLIAEAPAMYDLLKEEQATDDTEWVRDWVHRRDALLRRIEEAKP